MSSCERIKTTIAEHTVTVARMEERCSKVIAEMAQLTIDCLEAGNKVCFFGNGGSAADAQHLATEFSVRFTRSRKGLSGLAFTTDTSVITACANDFGFEHIFARQVEALCQEGDIAVGISTSGTSANVVAGLRMAREIGVTTFAFTGEAGRTCEEFADQLLAIPSQVTARIQECHMIAGHLICDIVEEHFENTTSPISAS